MKKATLLPFLVAALFLTGCNDASDDTASGNSPEPTVISNEEAPQEENVTTDPSSEEDTSTDDKAPAKKKSEITPEEALELEQDSTEAEVPPEDAVAPIDEP